MILPFPLIRRAAVAAVLAGGLPAGRSAAAPAPVKVPPPHAAIVAMSGTVQVMLAGSKTRLTGKIHAMVPEGALVMTGANSTCELVFMNAHHLRLGPETTVRIEGLPRPAGIARILLAMLKGRVHASVDPSLHTEFGLSAGTAVAAVKGTDFEVTTLANGEVSIAVRNGTVLVGTYNGTDLNAAFAAAQAGGVTVPAGYRTHTTVANGVATATRTPSAASLHVVQITGTMRITTTEGTVIVHAGDPIPDIPPGAEVTMVDGTAVLESNGISVRAEAGNHFTFDVGTNAAGRPSVSLQPLEGSSTVKMEVAGSLVSVQANEAATGAVDANGNATLIATHGTITVVDPLGHATEVTENSTATVVKYIPTGTGGTDGVPGGTDGVPGTNTTPAYRIEISPSAP